MRSSPTSPSIKKRNELKSYPTCCSILTGFVVARCKLYFAILSSRVRWTFAGVRSVTRVVAGATVFAGTVIGTKVEICEALLLDMIGVTRLSQLLALITEDATPAVFAVTLERLVARSMQAAGIFLAAITMRSFPSESTSDLLGLPGERATKENRRVR